MVERHEEKSKKMLGTGASQISVQITNIEQDGFWMLTPDGEYFFVYEDYPDFRNATVAQIYSFRQSLDGFHWPDLDVDIELDALKHPDRFPHKFKR
jgi:hypothetical protein